MLVLIAHLTVVPGEEEAFEAYEEVALDVFREHGGELISRFRPSEGPTEIHVLRCPDERAFEAFRADDRLKALADLRARAIVKTEMFKGHELPESA